MLKTMNAVNIRHDDLTKQNDNSFLIAAIRPHTSITKDVDVDFPDFGVFVKSSQTPKSLLEIIKKKKP